LKGAIDSRIAEEQARAKAAAGPSTIQRSNSARTDPPSKRPRPKPKVVDDGARGLDPSEFEAAFVIEDESEPTTRSGTPAPSDTKTSTPASSSPATGSAAMEKSDDGSDKARDASPAPRASLDLSPEVRQKLRKLEKLESRYQGRQA
jgi:hypothetical protein